METRAGTRTNTKKNSKAYKAPKATEKNKTQGWLARLDAPFLILVVILVLFGLLMLYSASYVTGIYRFGDSFHFFKSQLFFAGLGLAVMYFASVVDYRLLRKFVWPFVVGTIILLVIVLFMEPLNNAKRWIHIGTFGTFQPSEIAKFVIILLLSHHAAKYHKEIRSKNLGISLYYGVGCFLAPLVIVVFLLWLEPHYSAIVIITLITVIMMFVGGTALKWFVLGGTIAVGVLGTIFLSFNAIQTYVMVRVQNWVQSFSNPMAAGHQSAQSLLAIGSGGFRGLGLGNSRQKHLYVPEPQNDFIFSIICEELGFIGGTLVIVLFVLLLIRGVGIALRAKDRFGTMLVVGIMAQVMLQAVLNIAVVTNTIPNTGISLPFFSYGGTSLLMILGEMGIVLSVSRRGTQPAGSGEEDEVPA